jgi:pyruvate kinase
VRLNDLVAKTVLVRVDFNVPIHNGKIQNTRRIEAALPGIKSLIDQGCAVILATHLGRPAGKDPSLSTKILLPLLLEALSQDVCWVDQWPSEHVEWEKGKVYLLENLRFHDEELKCDDAWVKATLKNIDAVVMDAFSCVHRKHASIWGWINQAKSIFPGPLFEKEVHVLKQIISNRKHPTMAVVSGSKISTKTKLIEVLLERIDILVLGGGIANTFLKAKGFEVGNSLIDESMIGFCEQIVHKAEKLKKTILLPKDVCVLNGKGVCRNVNVTELNSDDVIYDVGQGAVNEIIQQLEWVDTVLWNGPLGQFEDERFNKSTTAFAAALKNHRGWTVVGGGDTVSALDSAGMLESMDYVSMAGGAFLNYIEQQGLPGVDRLYKRNREEIEPKRTKIVTTLGPSTDSEAAMMALISAGADVARINFSHGRLEEHVKRVALFRSCADKLGCVVGVIADLQGPKLRIGSFINDKVTLVEGEEFCLDLDCGENEGNEKRVSIFEPSILQDLSTGSILLLDDGAVSLRVLRVTKHTIECEVIIGGALSNNKGLNLKGGGLSAPALTDKDYADLKAIVKMDVDYIALSFVKGPEDVLKARSILKANKSHIGIISKLECAEVLNSLDEIINVSDGIMVARGDLAVEIGPAAVPVEQKNMIKRSRELSKPVIVATQMMESMVYSKKPTRAETSDVANAILDGADAIMMSSETAVGNHPALVVKTASDICRVVEKHLSNLTPTSFKKDHFSYFDEAIAMAAIYTALRIDVTALVALTESGQTPLWMSRARSDIVIFGLSRSINACRKMALYRGVMPVYFDSKKLQTHRHAREGLKLLHQLGYLSLGDHVIVTKGDKVGCVGQSNTLKIMKVEVDG